MEYEYLLSLRTHQSLRLLNADHMPLIVSFLHRVFIVDSARVLDQDRLLVRLDDYLYSINQSYADERYPRSARDYLEHWAGEAGYLRKYYVTGDDVPRYELTSATEKTIAWLESLKGRSFVGTESRLNTIFQLLRELVQQTETDRELRLAVLRQQKTALEAEIARVQSGDFDALDDTAVRERHGQLDDSARQLLRDFTEVEQNFRELDSQTRARIAQQDGSRADVLTHIFSDSDQIRASDQGKSFFAFCEFLMSPDRQEELDHLLEKLKGLDAIAGQGMSLELANLKINLLEASGKIMDTHHQLAEQLRRFLDDRVRLDNQRISRLIKSVERQLLDKDTRIRSREQLMELTDVRPRVDIPRRSLYRVPLKLDLNDAVEQGDGSDVQANVLFEQQYIDEERLTRRIDRFLQTREQVALAEILQEEPIEQGIAELIAYVKIASEQAHTLFDRTSQEWLKIDDQRSVKLPRIVFHR